MRLQELFERNITREINGVVKADQLTEKDIFQELDEYVITKEVLERLRTFFSHYCASIDSPTDRVGAWVSGFFGSGKSHFIKILSYLLENEPVTFGGVTRRPVDFFEEKIADAMLMADIKKAVAQPTSVILFNIDAKADVHDKKQKDTVLKVFMQVFDHYQGFCAAIPELAEMERTLCAKGLYDKFKDEFKRKTGNDWLSERDAFRLMPDDAVEAFASVTGQSEGAVRKWAEDAEKKYSLSVEKFAKLVQDYLKAKGAKSRIIFLVDEVGQYIGQDTQLMLNLQTITENLGTVSKGNAWVVVTSQEDIDKVLGDIKGAKANDFSKIQGRFNTRISLSSANTDEVIKKRLLEKKEEVKPELKGTYRHSKDILKNQLCFTADCATMKSFEAEADFVSSYPFIPYQFHLLQKVLESIRKAGVTGAHLARGERSMLDAFQQAVVHYKDEQTGALIPFHEFYTSIEGFLETIVVSTIKRAEEFQKLEPFDVQVLKTLFLIRYIDLIKPKVENIATLCITKIDEDKLNLKKRIETSLQRLEKETLIQRNGDNYSFLTNEERDVMNEIKNVEIEPAELASTLSELVFVHVFNDARKHRYLVNKRDYDFNRSCDGVYRGNASANLSLEVVSPLNDDYDAWNETKCIMESADGSGKVIFKLNQDSALSTEIRVWCQTSKYVKQKSSTGAAESFKRILSDQSEENRKRHERIVGKLKELILAASVYTVGQNREMKAASPEAMRQAAFDYLIENSYRKLNYIAIPVDEPEKKIKNILLDVSDEDLSLDLKDEKRHPNIQAILEVEDHLKSKFALNERITVKDLAGKFYERPWGWQDWDTVVIVAILFKNAKIRLLQDDELSFRSAAELLAKSRNWSAITIQKQISLDDSVRRLAMELARTCFHETPPSDGVQLAEFIKGRLEKKLQELERWGNEAKYANYPTKDFLGKNAAIFAETLKSKSPTELVVSFAGASASLQEFSDSFSLIEGFHTRQKEIYDKARRFEKDNAVNSGYLSGEAASQWRDFTGILSNASPFSQIHKLKGFMEKLHAAIESLLDEKRKEVAPKLDKLLAEFDAIADREKAPQDKRVEARKALEELKAKLSSAPILDTIAAVSSQADSVFDESCHFLEKAGKPKEDAPKLVKISVSSLAPRSCLETSQDVEDFISTLRERLESEIKAGRKVQIR